MELDEREQQLAEQRLMRVIKEEIEGESITEKMQKAANLIQHFQRERRYEQS